MTAEAPAGKPPRPDELLTPDDVRGLIRACSNTSSTGLRNRALITTLYRAGFRVCQALELRLDDVDLQARTIASPRGGRGHSIALDAGSFRVIERWIDRRGEAGIPPEAPLFCTLAARPLSSSYLRGLFGRLASKTGIDKPVSAEALRRSLALELVKEGYTILDIQSQLGHSAASVTGRYLARLANESGGPDLRRRADWRP
jgi:integrase/recombinase XerC